MVGSQAYTHAIHNAGENVVAAINLDMILHPGWDNVHPDPDYDLDILTNPDSAWFAQDLLARYAAYTPIAVKIDIDNYGNSDHSSFWNEGYSAVRLGEHTTPETWPTDVFDNPHLDWEFGRHVVRGGMAELVGLAGLVVPEPGTAALVAVLVLSVRRMRRVR